jgi:predicted DNA-binding transcriptional regulator AlpA
MSPTEASLYLNVSRYHLLKLADKADFPKPIALTPRTLKWKKYELDARLGKQ